MIIQVELIDGCCIRVVPRGLDMLLDRRARGIRIQYTDNAQKHAHALREILNAVFGSKPQMESMGVSSPDNLNIRLAFD